VPAGFDVGHENLMGVGKPRIWKRYIRTINPPIRTAVREYEKPMAADMKRSLCPFVTVGEAGRHTFAIDDRGWAEY